MTSKHGDHGQAVPELTSAESMAGYPPGEASRQSHGAAWRDVQMSVFSLTSAQEAFDMPAVSEPFIVWVVKGEAETQEREVGAPDWTVSRIQAGSLFLTMAGAPYAFRWRRLSTEPLEVVLLLLGMPIFEAALLDIHGDTEVPAFRNVSGTGDDKLVRLLQALRDELDERSASALFVGSMAAAIAVHLARHYVEADLTRNSASSALPGFKVRMITAWMRENLAEPFSLARLADMVSMSESHFNRLFKKATGLPPSQFHIRLRMEEARRLLRETSVSVVEIANRVGYANPSHFTQLFRKETGATPSDYRRQL